MGNSSNYFPTFVRVSDDKQSSSSKCFNMSFSPSNVLMSRLVGENCPGSQLKGSSVTVLSVSANLW